MRNVGEGWIARVAAIALDRFDDTMALLGLSGGKWQGREYLPLNPKRADHAAGSFSINADTGAWGDFATGDRGRDLVSLAAYLWDEKQGEAARRLAAHFGIEVPAPKDGPPAGERKPGKGRISPASDKPPGGPNSRPAARTLSAGEIVMPVPDDAPLPPKAHPKMGAPARQWEYRDAAGRLLFLVCRFEVGDGGKDIRPLSLRRMPSGKLEWRWLGAAPPRPLYGLDRLAARPDAPVMICEGEKAADAAAVLFPDYVVITSPNGAKAADKADWSPLAGRRCVLWLDADEAGEGYGAEVAKQLGPAGTAEVLRLDASIFLGLPDGSARERLPQGWDAADAVGEGFTAELVAARMAANAGALKPICDDARHPAPAADDAGEVWLFDDAGQPTSSFKQRGTLEEWRREVAARCVGNSRLVFAVSLAFASPLLHVAEMESGGFHLISNSSNGKTTAMRVAASVCGGHDYMQRWRATDNGLEALAMQHCDAPLLLDELAQLDPRAAGEVAYMLANGAGKARAQRAGGMRDTARWRLLFLSAGEIGLAQHMAEAGKQTKAGQEIRIAEIPADAGAGLGVFEELHGEANGAEFARALDRAIRKYHGTAFPAFLDALTRQQGEIADTLREARKAFARRYLSEEASGQARRVADRFALVGAAGELATRMGITGWPGGAAILAAATCFEAWLAQRGGEGNQEERTMLAQVRGFLERHGEGRFTDWGRPVAKDDHAPRVQNRAGWRRRVEGESTLPDEATTEFLIYPQVFKEEVCKGFNATAVAKLLAVRGYLKAEPNGGKLAPKFKPPGEAHQRMYHVLPAIFEVE